MILNEQNGYNFVKDIISDLSTMFDDVWYRSWRIQTIFGEGVNKQPLLHDTSQVTWSLQFFKLATS